MKTTFLLGVLLSCFAAVCSLTSCGPPGYEVRTEQFRKRVLAIGATNDIAKWAAEQLAANRSSITNRPAVVLVKPVPKWVTEIFGFSPECTAVFGKLDREDHISIHVWTGRGAWGMKIGGIGYPPNLDPGSFFVLLCKPGVYFWHSRTGG